MNRTLLTNTDTPWYIHAVIYVAISVLALLLVIVVFIDPSNTKENQKEQTVGDYKVYNETLDRIFALNVGDPFDKETLKTFEAYGGELFTIWVDVKYQDAYSSLYEIKGLTNRDEGHLWRFYIKTESGYIISIVKQ